MSVTNKTLFVVERNLRGSLTLDDIASASGVSRFHLSHAFGETTGMSVIQYVRARRLSEAAKELNDGASDILELALDFGYGSHEAFTRAFKAFFGKSPEQIRLAGSLEGLALVEPVLPSRRISRALAEPTIRRASELRFVGSKHRVRYGEMKNVAGLWEMSMPNDFEKIENKVHEPPVGLATNADEYGIEYMCAVGVSKFDGVPEYCSTARIKPASYVVFDDVGHIVHIRETYEAIWNEWLPEHGKTPSGGPCIESHKETFDPRTGNGGVTTWIPVEA